MKEVKLFSKKGEHKHLNTQGETPFLTTSVIVAKTNRDNPKQEQTIGNTEASVIKVKDK